MKNLLSAILILVSSVSLAQVRNSRSNYQSVGVSLGIYSKPGKPSDLPTFLYSTPSTFDEAKRNLGLSLNYSQMNFIGNSGIEYGAGLELMFMNAPMNIRYIDSVGSDYQPIFGSEELNLNPGFRKVIAATNIPIYAVYKIELGKHLTLMPKAGVNAKILVYSDELGTGTYQDQDNRLSYNIRYQMEDSRSSVMLHSAFGTSLGWKMKNGDLITFNAMFNLQVTQNSLISKITDIEYLKDGELEFDSENVYPAYQTGQNGEIIVNASTSSGPVYAEHKTSSLSLGISYNFKGGKRNDKKSVED